MRIFLRPDRSAFEVHGLASPAQRALESLAADAWSAHFSVRVEPEPAQAREPRQVRPMLGRYEVRGGVLCFTPDYPLLPGRRYRACFGETVEIFAVPLPEALPPAVTRVYPSAQALPENLLRFYVYFSAPMREEEALQHLRLLDERGEEVPGAFLDPHEELWDPGRTRLTLLLDPGRVKTGLGAHEKLGRALRAGRSYRLLIDSGWRDARGEPSRVAFEKPFQVVAAAVRALEVARWQVEAPTAGSTEPLRLRFPAPLDHALLGLCLRVRRPGGAGAPAEGSEVPGRAEGEGAETGWRFTPAAPWLAGAYSVEVDARLEDVAGNNLRGPFDRPMRAGRLKTDKLDRATVPFVVAG